MATDSSQTMTLVIGNVPTLVVREMLDAARWHHMKPDAWFRAVIEAELFRHRLALGGVGGSASASPGRDGVEFLG